MRIAHVTYHYKPIVGGQEVLTETLLRTLEAAGFEQVVYQADWGCSDNGMVMIPKLPAPLRFGALDQYFFQVRLVASHFSSLRKCGIVIVQYANYYPLLAWHPNVIVLSHGVLWNRPTNKLHHRFIRFVSRKTFHRPTVVANDTDYLREMGIAIRPGEKCFEEVAPGKWFIPNCVDTGHFCPAQPLPELAGKKIILVPRNIRYERGIHIAIQAFARLLKPHPELTLLIVGSTWDQNYLALCRNLVRDLALGDRVVFFGPASRQLMPRIYSSALVSLVPSLLTEGTSLSALEGMACAVPTVASDVGGLPDLPCILVPSNDSRALAQQVLLLLDDENARAEIARRQQKLVCQRFNLHNWAQAWRKVIQKAAPSPL